MIRRNAGPFSDDHASLSHANLKAPSFGNGAAAFEPGRETAEKPIRSPFVARARAKRAEDEARRQQEKYIRDQFMELFGRMPTSDDIWERPEDKE